VIVVEILFYFLQEPLFSEGLLRLQSQPRNDGTKKKKDWNGKRGD
jgi:hypothetical protein